jgi:hypothetical protein
MGINLDTRELRYALLHCKNVIVAGSASGDPSTKKGLKQIGCFGPFCFTEVVNSHPLLVGGDQDVGADNASHATFRSCPESPAHRGDNCVGSALNGIDSALSH